MSVLGHERIPGGVRTRRVVVPLSTKAVHLKCSDWMKAHNKRESPAKLTAEKYPAVFEFRTARSCVKEKLDLAIHTAFQKRWAQRVSKTAYAKRDGPSTRVRLLNEKKEVIEGVPYQLRQTKHGIFVVFKRLFSHRKRDLREAGFIAVPMRFIIDPV